jgi:23S rRNA (guanine745-N1)-methyltransferase
MVLACSVRGCGAPLERGASAFTCARGHAFDVARSGYVNLLQPQDRRSKEPGDSPEAVFARRALHDAGFGRALTTTLIDCVERADVPSGAACADLGCGEGTHLFALVDHFRFAGFGVDLSVHAIEAAAKRHSGVTWIVANADRTLPFLDGSLALVVSIDGRRNTPEIARVLAPGGAYVVAVPAEDDLAELREAVLGAADAPDRTAAVLKETAGGFDLVERTVARERRRFGPSELALLAVSSYRCGRTRERDKLATVGELDITSSHHVLRLRRSR